MRLILAAVLLSCLGVLVLVGLRASTSGFPRWAGLSGIVGGLFVLANVALAPLVAGVPGGNRFAGSLLAQPIVTTLVTAVAALLITAGIAGLVASLEGQSRLGSAGMALIYASTATLIAVSAYQLVFMPERVGPPEGTAFALANNLAAWGGIIGLVLVGFATFRARILGAFRALPLGLGLLTTPLPRLWLLMAFGDLPPESLIPILALPPIVYGLGWILLGYTMLRKSTKD